MKKCKILFCTVTLFVMGLSLPAFASDAFHITYQQENVSVTNGVLTGDLIVNIINNSGQDVKDVAVSVAGSNNVTYDNHQAVVGDVANGQMIGAITSINAPEEMQNGEAADEVVWNVEFTNSLGERQTVAVTGRKVQ